MKLIEIFEYCGTKNTLTTEGSEYQANLDMARGVGKADVPGTGGNKKTLTSDEISKFLGMLIKKVTSSDAKAIERLIRNNSEKLYGSTMDFKDQIHLTKLMPKMVSAIIKRLGQDNQGSKLNNQGSKAVPKT